MAGEGQPRSENRGWGPETPGVEEVALEGSGLSVWGAVSGGLRGRWLGRLAGVGRLRSPGREGRAQPWSHWEGGVEGLLRPGGTGSLKPQKQRLSSRPH